MNISEVAGGKIKNVRLTNILCTDATVITSDCYALYSTRGIRVSAAQGMLTSTVAENIHQEKDESLKPSRDGETLAPFKTVLRGIAEEISPELARRLDPKCILLLGIAFNLRNFHPDMLFVVVVPYRAEEVIQMKMQYQGKDYYEITLSTISASRDHAELEPVLSDSNWLPGGKASVIRAIEFLDAAAKSYKLPLEEVIRRLASGSTEWLVS
jgi:hypothetical protein